MHKRVRLVRCCSAGEQRKYAQKKVKGQKKWTTTKNARGNSNHLAQSLNSQGAGTIYSTRDNDKNRNTQKHANKHNHSKKH